MFSGLTALIFCHVTIKTSWGFCREHLKEAGVFSRSLTSWVTTCALHSIPAAMNQISWKVERWQKKLLNTFIQKQSIYLNHQCWNELSFQDVTGFFLSCERKIFFFHLHWGWGFFFFWQVPESSDLKTNKKAQTGQWSVQFLKPFLFSCHHLSDKELGLSFYSGIRGVASPKSVNKIMSDFFFPLEKQTHIEKIHGVANRIHKRKSVYRHIMVKLRSD